MILILLLFTSVCVFAGKMMLEDNSSADVQVLFDFLDNELDYAPFVSYLVYWTVYVPNVTPGNERDSERTAND